MLKVDPAFLAVLIGSGLPLLTALVTKWFAKSHEKALVNLTLSALTGVLVQAQHAGGIFSKQTLIAAGLAYVVSVAAHTGLWKPTGIAEWIGKIAPFTGIGSSSIPPGTSWKTLKKIPDSDIIGNLVKVHPDTSTSPSNAVANNTTTDPALGA